jgi:hypothetical protein
MSPRLREAVWEWGSAPEERERSYPCDRFLPDADQIIHRAVDVDAPASVSFRWLCQLRVAPYSYDWIDNRGRRSPRELTPGIEALEVGQRVMTIFELVDFEPGRSLTLRHHGRIFGRIAVSYLAEPQGEGKSRMVVRMRVRHPKRLITPLLRAALPPGDLVMMRRQLLNLKGLAERG